MKRALKKTILIAALTGVLMILGLTAYRSQRYLDQQREIRFISQIPVFLPNGRVLKVMSMGHQALLADYFWIQSVIYFGRRVIDPDNIYYLYELYDGNLDQIQKIKEHHTHAHTHGETFETHRQSAVDTMQYNRDQQFKTHLMQKQFSKPVPPDSIPFIDQNAIPRIFEFPGYGLMNDIFPLLDRATILNPYFKTPYLFSSIAVLQETGEIEKVLKLLKVGYQYNPDEWEFPFYLAYIHWLYKGEIDVTIQYLTEAVYKPDCPGYVGALLVGFTNRDPQGQVIQLYLQSLLESTENQDIRERIEALLAQMEVKTNEGP